MKSFYQRITPIIFFTLLLTACSPHPATGVWKATDDNKLGIARLVAGFEGRVEFTTSKLDNAVWHCFWGISDKTELSLDCTPSTNPEKKRSFILTVNDKGIAELRDSANRSELLATFIRLDENPSPKK